jgi:hypothetical protein
MQQQLISAKIEEIRQASGVGPVGLARLRPEQDARPHHCFENAMTKARRSGGAVVYGWTFHHRLVDAIPGPGYLFTRHHAVWHASDGSLVDVTPHPEAKHRPYGTDDSIVFLVDHDATPIVTGNQMAPRPMQFFPLAQDERLIAYTQELNEREAEACKAIYAVGRPQR